VAIVSSGSNEGEAFRYFTAKSRNMPVIAWTRKVIPQLLQIARARVDEFPLPKSNGDFVVSLVLEVFEPQKGIAVTPEKEPSLT
jgi:hypothetical protein